MIKDFLTVVIPTKNESELIDITLGHLNKQHNINGTKVIICDCSDDNTLEIVNSGKYKNLDIVITDGGLPSVARNNGASLCITPYVLFMDADMFILNPDLLFTTVNLIITNQQDLVTCKIRSSENGYNYVFRFFDVIQRVFKPITPFCLGGFMLVRKERFDEIGGFDEDAKVAEDYLLSKEIRPNKFEIADITIFTTPRRFKSKGLWYMLKLMIGSFFNNKNKKFFQNDKDYWK